MREAGVILRGAAAVACWAALGGCSIGGGEREAKPPRGAPKQVADAVLALDRATRAGDWARVCNELFTTTARRRAGGQDCARLLRSAARDVREPRIELRAIDFRGATAHARVRTLAQGQAPISEVIVLRRERGRYRIESLAG